MFRANRIGTPHIYKAVVTESAADFTPYVNAATSREFRANVINAVPILDFGYTNLSWNGAEVVPTLNQFALVQQVTVTEPLAGDTVGIELVGGLSIVLPYNATITPVFSKADAAASVLLSSVAGSYGYMPLEHNREPLSVSTDAAWRHVEYKTQVVMNGPTVAGVYLHGFQIIHNSGGNMPITAFHVKCAARQLNDQEDISYRDTRR